MKSPGPIDPTELRGLRQGCIIESSSIRLAARVGRHVTYTYERQASARKLSRQFGNHGGRITKSMNSYSIRTKVCISALALLSLASPVSRAGSVGNTTIVEVAIQKQFCNCVFIRTAGLLAGPASCYTNGYWHFTLSFSNPGDRELYAMVLSAFHSGSTVGLSGTGTCNEFGSIESLASINLVK
jgi:hypothetical protein